MPVGGHDGQECPSYIRDRPVCFDSAMVSAGDGSTQLGASLLT